MSTYSTGQNSILKVKAVRCQLVNHTKLGCAEHRGDTKTECNAMADNSLPNNLYKRIMCPMYWTKGLRGLINLENKFDLAVEIKNNS